jgi:hypothetical protein
VAIDHLEGQHLTAPEAKVPFTLLPCEIDVSNAMREALVVLALKSSSPNVPKSCVKYEKYRWTSKSATVSSLASEYGLL